MPKLKREPHTPRNHQIFWCSHCDSNRVDSQLKETGNFYLQFGHSYSAESREYDGEYTVVMFALCAECDPDFSSQNT